MGNSEVGRVGEIVGWEAVDLGGESGVPSSSSGMGADWTLLNTSVGCCAWTKSAEVEVDGSEESHGVEEVDG